MSKSKPHVLYHAVVRERGTLRELARYSYASYKEAQGAVQDLRRVRQQQNGESVTVTLEK